MDLKDKWDSLEIKTRIAYATAVVAFVCGWVLTFIAFFIGKGQIHDSVLWVLGQALVYTASILGVGMYVTGEVGAMKRGVRDFMKGNGKGIVLEDADKD